jgi:translocation and assembly module TamB
VAQRGRDAVVTKADFYRDDLERTQRMRSDGRRRGRLRRKSTFALLLLGFVVLVVVGAPSLVCQSPLAKSLIASSLEKYGFQGGVESVRVGWVTPLRIDGLDLTGMAAGSHLTVDRVETDLTILKCLSGLGDLGEIAVRGVVLDVFVTDGNSSVEDDLAVLLADDGSEKDDHDEASTSSTVAKI